LGADAPARLYTRHRTAAPAGSSAPPAREAPAKNGAGIGVGDRAAVRFLDEDKVVTLTLDAARHDPVNGLAGATTPLGRALTGLSDEDEGAYVEDGRERRFLVMRVETSGPARRPAS
jgi:transcription elongation GreA/GreB family factor